MTAKNLIDEIEALGSLGLEGLRQVWRARFGEPPALRSRELLARVLTWKLQAAVAGGLDVETRRLLRQSSHRKPRPQTGVRLVREWKGVRHEVEVTDSGYAFSGNTYASLSVIARRITGARWNGPRFFGLRQDKAGP